MTCPLSGPILQTASQLWLSHPIWVRKNPPNISSIRERTWTRLQKNETGYTALTGAVSQNHNEVAKLLLKKGANVNHQYEGGFTPLMHAAFAGNVELVNLLLEKGADPNARNGEGKTPLTFAREKGHDSVVELLRKRGAE